MDWKLFIMMVIKMTEKQFLCGATPRYGKSEYTKKEIEFLNNAIKETYKSINDYLEYIFKLPSTINRILVYYAIGFNPSEPNKRSIYYNGKCVRRYELEIPKIDLTFGYYKRGLNK